VKQPGVDTPVQIKSTDDGHVWITVNNRTFTADLPFMNRFGICRACEGIKKWQYYYPNGRQSSPMQVSSNPTVTAAHLSAF
jgi:hypothetical protein